MSILNFKQNHIIFIKINKNFDLLNGSFNILIKNGKMIISNY